MSSIIPKIDITTEFENDDENEHNLSSLNFLEALTDVEDLYDETPKQKVKKFKKNKLKISLKEKDDATTDLEDFEGSDNENEPNFVKHKNPLPNDVLDPEDGVFEETYKTQIRNPKGKKRLSTQESIIRGNERDRIGLEKETDEGLTDVENCDTDTEFEVSKEICDSSISVDQYFKNDNIEVSEHSNLQNPQEVNFKIQNDLYKNTQYLSAQSISSQLSDLTDVEMINSDSDEEFVQKKPRKKRTKTSQIRKDFPATDVEDLELSESGFRKAKKNSSGLKYRSQSFPFYSDNDTRIHFPVCKKIASRKENHLTLPEFCHDILTDTEEFESENPIKITDIVVDELALEEKLMEIASSYSRTEENHSVVKEKSLYLQKANCEPDEVLQDQNDTDVDECQTDETTTPSDERKKFVTECPYGIKFSNNNIEATPKLKINKDHLSLPLLPQDELTDVENLDSSPDYEKTSKKIPSALFTTLTNLTDEEDIQSDQDEQILDFPEVILPNSVRNLILMQENNSLLPTVRILPLDDTLSHSPVECPPSEEEFLSDNTEDNEENHQEYFIPDVLVGDGDFINISEDIQKNTSFTKIGDDKTDTEEIIVDNQKRRRAPKFKHFKGKLTTNLVVGSNSYAPLTDTEDLYLDGDTKSLLQIPISHIVGHATDVEYIDSSDSDLEEDKKNRVYFCCTPEHLREMGGGVVLSKENSGPITKKDRLTVDRKLSINKNFPVSPVGTDTEDVGGSPDEELNYSRECTPTQDQIHQDVDHNLHIESRKFDVDAPENVMYLKGGSYQESPTDVEEIYEDFKENGNNWKKHEFKRRVILNLNDGSVAFGFHCKELDAVRRPIQVDSLQTGRPTGRVEEIIEEDHQRGGGVPQIITYESVLLTPTRNMHTLPSQNFIHKTTSYTQIDSMLEKMLNEVDRQEKIFGLDLDILEPEDTCVNTLELIPSTDALIEIPVKKAMKKPQKLYESFQEILISDDPYEIVSFNNNRKSNEDSSNLYDLISFDDNPNSDQMSKLEEISKTIDSLILAVEDDEAAMLLDSSFESNDLPNNYQLHFVRRASSESLSDNYPDSWDDLPEPTINPDYEPIDQNPPLKYAYQLYDNRTGNDIWWEGTYRNLSIVPEEDEENISLLGSYSGKSFKTPRSYYRSTDLDSNQSSALSSSILQEAPEENSSNTSTTSSDLTSSDEGHYETFEKIVKAEVKLLVKTSEKGKEAIEIRSVREFMENPKESNPITGTSNKEPKSRNPLLPSKFTEKFSNITNKFSSILESKKKTSNYCVLPEESSNDKNKKTGGKKNSKPSFTLPRLFIRTPEVPVENIKKARSESNLLYTKELSKSRTELVATPNEKFPLHFDPNSHTLTPEDERKIDLYANIPFYPCYNQYTARPLSFQTNPLTEFISNPFSSNNPNLPQAYCDWLPEKEDVRGKPTSPLVINEDTLVDKPVGTIPAGLSSTKNNLNANFKTITDQTNALIQSESRAEPFNAHTEKHYKIDKSEDEKAVEVQPKDEKKPTKKGFLGTLKTFVSKSIDHSDSDSEKSSKKDKHEKKLKKDKKKKKKPVNAPKEEVQPPRKPKLPTPTEEHRKFDDIPYADLPPPYKPPEIPQNSYDQNEIDLQNVQVTDLDAEDTEVTNIKEQANEIVSKVITDSENVAATIIADKSPKKQRSTKITIVEEIKKTIAPVVIEEEEFSIVVDPTRKESPKKSRETFTLNIDESIEQIEKEIMEKSPILPEEKILKPVIDPNSPVREKPENVYEDVIPIVSEMPLKLRTEEYREIEELKKVKIDLGENKIIDIIDEQDKKPDNQKGKKKQGKLFGLFGKSARETDESDDDSKKEVIEKQDKEIIKEKKVEETEDSKRGFLNLFGKKSKKEDSIDNNAAAVEVEIIPQKSEELVKAMKASDEFLSKEIINYEDGRDTSLVDGKKKKSEKDEQTEEQSQALEAKEKTKKPKNRESEESAPLIEVKEKKKKIKKDDQLISEDKFKKEDSSEPEENKKGFLGGLFKKSKKESLDSESKPVISETVLKDMESTTSFLKQEIDKYHDVRPEIIEKTETICKLEDKKLSTEVKSTVDNLLESRDATTDLLQEEFVQLEDSKAIPKSEEEKEVGKSSGLFGLFTKKKSQDRESSVESEPKKKDKKDKKEKSPIKIISPEKSKKDKKDKSPAKLISPEKVKKTKKETEEEEKSPGKTKKDKKDQIDEAIEVIQDETKTQIVLSETVLKQMDDSNNFLSTEIENYHDMKLVTKEELEEPQIESKEVREKSTGFFGGIFAKKPKKEKEDVQVKEKEAIEEKIPAASLDKTDENKRDDVLITQDDIVPPEKVAKEIEESTNFLSTEVENYHDTKSVVKQPATESKDTVEKSSKFLGGIFAKKPKKEKDESQTKVEISVEESATALSSIEKSKVQKHKTEEEQIVKSQIVLSEKVLQEISDSNNFLSNEVEKYEDVKPILTEELSELPVESKEPTEKSTGFFGGIFTKKPKKEKEEPQIKEKVCTEETAPSLLSPEKTKEDKKETMEGTQVAKVDIVLSEKVLNDICDSTNFLNTEIENYHDVKPDTKKDQHSDSTIERKEVDEKPSGFFSGIFTKKTKKDKDESEIKENIVVEETITLSSTMPKEGIIDEKLVEKEEIVLSEKTMKDISDSKTFLSSEVEKYQDVEHVLKEEAPSECLTDSKEITEKSSGFFGGIFARKPKKEKDEVLIQEKISVEEVQSSSLQPGEPKQDPKDVVEIKIDAVLSEKVLKEISDSTNFLSTEVENYDDVKPVLNDKPPLEFKEESEKSTGFFSGIFSKKSKKEKDELITKEKISVQETITSPPSSQQEVSEEVLQKMVETKSFISTEVDQYHDVRPKEAEEKPIKVEAVIKDIVSPVHKLGESLSDETLKDLSKLDQDIRETIDNLKDDTDIFEVTNGTIVSEDTDYKLETSEVFQQEQVNYEDEKSVSREQTSAERDTKEKKTGLFGLFGMRRSQEREMSVEKEMTEIEIKNKKEERRKSGSPFRIFGKKQKSEEEVKKVELTKEVLKQISDTNAFLSQEVENYEDVMPKLEAEPIIDAKAKETEEKTEKRKSGSFFSIFSKSGDEEKEKIQRQPSEERKVEKTKKQPSEERKIEKAKKPSSEERKTEKGKKRSFEERNVDTTKKESSEERGSLEEKKAESEEKVQMPEEILKQMDDTHQFLSTEIDNYEDVKLLKTTESIEKDTDESDDVKSTGLFGIFSKKDKKDSPKATKKKYKKQKKEKSIEEPEKVGIIEKIGRKLTSTVSDSKDQVEDAADRLQEEINKENARFEAEISNNIKQSTDTFKEDLLRRQESLEREIQESKELIQSPEMKVKQQIGEDVSEAEKAAKKSGGFFTKLGDKLTLKEKEEKRESVDRETKKSGGGFFSKLTEKVSSKTDEQKTKLDTTVTEGIKCTEESIEDLRRNTVEEIGVESETEKADTSNFVSEIMQSFDKHLEDIKDKAEEIEDKSLQKIDDKVENTKQQSLEFAHEIKKEQEAAKESFRQTVDEKFSSTMKLTEEIAKTLEDKALALKDTTSKTVKDISENLEDTTCTIVQKSKKIEEVSKDVKEKTFDKTQELKTTIKEKADELTEDSTKIKDKTLEKAVEVSKTIKNKFEDDSIKIKENIEEESILIKEKAENTVEDLKSVIKEKTDVIDDTSKKAKERTIEETINLKSSIKQKSEEIEEGAKKLEQKTIEKTDELKTAATEKVQESKSFFGKLGDKISKKTKGATDKIKHEGGKVKEIIKDKKSKAGTTTKEISDSSKESIRTVKDEIQDKAQEIQTASHEVGKEIKDRTNGTAEILKELVEDTKIKTEKVVAGAAADTVTRAEEKMAEVKSETKSTISKLGEDIHSKLDLKEEVAGSATIISGTVDKAIEKATNLSDGIEDRLEKFEHQITEKQDKLVETSKDIVEKAKIVGFETKAGIQQKTAEAFDKTKTSLEEKSKNAIDNTNEIMIETKTCLEEKSKQLQEISSEIALETKDIISQSAKDTKEKIKSIKSDTSEKIKEKGKEKFDKLTDIQQGVQSKGKEFTDTVVKEIKVTQEAVKENIAETFHSTESKVKYTKDVMQESLPAGKEQIAKGVKKVDEVITGKIKDSKESVTKTEHELKDSVKDIQEKFEEKSGDAVKETCDTFKDVKDKLTEEIDNKFIETDQLIKAKISEAKDVSKDVSDEIVQTKDKIIKDTDQTIKQISDKVKSIEERFAKETTEEKIVDVIKSTDDKVKEGKEILEDSSSKLESQIDKSIDQGKDLITKSKESAVVQADKLQSKSDDTVTGMKQGFEEATESVKATLEQEKQKIDSTQGQLIQIGKETEDNIKETTTQIIETSIKQVGQLEEGNQDVTKLTETIVTEKAQQQIEELSQSIQSGIEDADGKAGKAGKQSKGFLNKLGRKLSGKGDELKGKKKSEDESSEGEKQEKKGKKTGILGKFKLKSKSEEKANVEQAASTVGHGKEEKLPKQEEDIKTDVLIKEEKIEGVEKPIHDMKFVKQKTSDFLEELRGMDSQSLKPKEFGEMTRTVSDYGCKQEVESVGVSISEANIDLSNFPKGVDEYPARRESSSYVTSPTLARRTASQRLSTSERPAVMEVRSIVSDDVSDEEIYVVTEPEEPVLPLKSPTDSIRKPLFHIESEEDDSFDLGQKLEKRDSEDDSLEPHPKLEKRDSVRSNILESLTEKKIDTLINDLTKNLDDATKTVDIDIPQKIETKLEEHKEKTAVEVDIIEQKLRDLDKALDSLEQFDNDLDKGDANNKTEKKLKRVERKFERMASEVMEKENQDAKQQKMSTPEVEEKRESEFQTLVSQLSVEEVSDFQREYSHLWDEHTFSKSDEWDSKTPDSQADAQDLPQGDIVYMGPVNLNKDHLVNKAGIEVDVIPIMKSPCMSPKPKKKKNHRAKSTLGFYRNNTQKTEDDRGSLPDLKSSPLKRSLVSTVLQMNPSTFLSASNESLDQRSSRSLGSTDSMAKGSIMNAVVNWLQRSSSFASTENIDRRSATTSLSDTLDCSLIVNDDDDEEEHSLDNFELYFDERNPAESYLVPLDICSDAKAKSSSCNKKVNDEKENAVESSCGPAAPSTTLLTTTAESTKTIPQPKPRSAKTPETPLQFSTPQTNIEDSTKDKQISPVRDDLLDSNDDQAEVLESYSDRKKFWENVTKESTTTKRMSLQDVTVEKNILAKKRASVQEFSTPPVPKPRSSTLQTSQSVCEPEDLESSKKMSVKDRAISFESTASDSSGVAQTELTKISESDDLSLEEDKMMTEYQASFMPPSERKIKPIRQELEEIKHQSIFDQLEKSDSIDSDVAQKGSSQLIENTGYISDSEDVEQYISDSEIEDRVPQIRERQMSVFSPPVAPARRSIYERSASLPTEDLYEVSARSIKLRKQYYEEQIKKEMIEEQLISEVEDEPSPERKTLLSLSEMRSEEEKIDELEMDEKCEEKQPLSSVKDLAKTFEEKSKLFKDTSEESIKKFQNDEEKMSVKSLAQGYEKQLGSVIAGQKIGQSSIEMHGFVLEKQLQESKIEDVKEEISPKDIRDFMEITQDDDITHKLMHKTVEDRSTISSQILSETHKEIDVDIQPTRPLESQPSVSSDKSSEHNFKEDSISKPDSMEVHVDKSEIEDSEKLAELDQDATDFETKSIDSLNAEISPKASNFSDDNIPEITVTLSGKQRRISEESDEYVDKKPQEPPVTPVSEKSETESPIRQPEEHIQDTVWEVSVQSQPEPQFDEKVVEIPSETNLKMKIKERKISEDKVGGEKDDDLSSSIRDESDLGSEIHQDHSDSNASDKIKSESQTDIEKIILDSLHQQCVDPEEAKKIASALIEEIEAEIQKQEKIVDSKEKSAAVSEHSKGPVSEYLRHLAETKGLDEREVELVESVLARRQRELAKLTRGDTQASSMEITDEDLKYSGAELDYSHLLEQQMDQLEAERVADNVDYDAIEREQAKQFQDKTTFSDKINEDRVKETKTSQDYESYEDSKTTAFKKDSHIKTSESVRGEKSLNESKNIIFEEDETVSESATEELEKFKTHIDTVQKEILKVKSDDLKLTETKVGIANLDSDHKSEISTTTKEIEGKDTFAATSAVKTAETDSSRMSGKVEVHAEIAEKTDESLNETKLDTEKLFDQIQKEENEVTLEEKREVKQEEDGSQLEIISVVDKKHSKISSSTITVDRVHEKSITSSKISDEILDLEKILSTSEIEKLKPEEGEIVIKSHEIVKRTSSSDSKSSLESAKSPEDQFSTCSSGRKGDSDPQQKISDVENVILRKLKSDADTSSSSSNLKPDRKSGVDFETYSSSGESYYHSFELDSNKSRPCSSDVEGLIAAGSSEYESALTSQEISGKSHVTSTEYQTAVSSLSSKESMKSLDSESSGNLASIEVSEVSETLVPSTSDLDGDILDMVDQQLLDDIEPTSDWTSKSMPIRQSTEVSDSELLSYQGVCNESIDISEEENGDMKQGIDIQSKMKRSYEMTFQPEPKILLPESPQIEAQDGEEKFGTSLEDGSVLSMSVSSTSSTGVVRTVIELSRADSERQEGSMTISGTSEQLSIDDMDNLPRGSRESLAHTPTPLVTSDISTSTPHIPTDLPIDTVTITTSTVDENGIQSVSTQVTSETHSPVDEIASSVKPELDEPKKKGHRRQESTSSFVPSMINITTRREIEAKYQSDLAESDKYTSKLSFKEVSSDEKKDVDECEKDECYETEADQGFHQDLREGRYLDTESDNELDLSRPQSHLSKSDSERPASIAFSDDRPDSELVDLHVRSSDKTDETEPFERPISPEPCDETKDDTPELSSEAQASVGELEQEYSAAVSRSPEIGFIEHRRSLTKDITSDILTQKEPLEKRDSHGKSSSTSSEKSSFEEAEAEAAFSMVAHVSPAHKIKQICPILEDEDAEKHELETREKAQKEFEKRRAQLRDQSPGFIPDIKVTQHMTPLVDSDFTYPDLELEAKEKELEAQTPQTPASNSSKSSEETDQGREYVLDDVVQAIPEEPEHDQDQEPTTEDKIMLESKSEGGTVVETTLKEDSDKETDSPNSDSFEMLEKPDLIDDFVVIEEVGKEAHEFDSEGKSLKIHHKGKRSKKHDEEVEEFLVKSAPTPLTKMTDIKYYPDGSSSDELGFEFEDSPPQDKQKNAGTTTKKDYGNEYDRELEANKKWMEQQFQGDQAAMIAAGYGYEMEFERGPLEDIKEEDVNDFDPTSSRIGSLGSQKESGGSLGSVKDSYSSTPEYDVLAGRKYFTRSGEHDDVSMSSLQEFENLEQAMSLEMRRYHQGSQDSSSNGSFKTRYLASKSGQGDDISVSSLKEFEGLEKACIAAHKIEVKVKEEEAMLSQIDEGQESITSESESCETISGTEKKIMAESDEEDYEKRMFEIDEIIRQAQNNVERFIDLKEAEKTESLGRGDSIEEVSKVPELDLDTPVVKSTVKVQWKEGDDVMITSTDSLDLKLDKPSHHDSTDSLDQKTAGDIMTASTDSIEFQQKAKDTIMTDSIEIKDEKSFLVSSDSLELGQATSSGNNLILSDSIDEDGSRIGIYDQSSSSTGKDLSSSTKEEEQPDVQVQDFMLESTDSLDPTSSTATHATYQYETDSVFSGSFTSGGSNTMVSSTDTIDPMHVRETVDVAAAARKVWFDEEASARRGFTTEYIEDNSKPYVTEVIEPSDEESFSHVIHRRVELPPEIRKMTFTGPDAQERLRQFMDDFGEGEEVQETEEVDAAGNVHVKKVVQKRFIMKSEGEQPMTSKEIDEYFKQMETPAAAVRQAKGVITKTVTDGQGVKTTFTQQFDFPQTQELTTSLTKIVTGGEVASSTTQPEQTTTIRTQVPQSRRKLRYDISVDDQTEVDPREHDWRINLPNYGESDETPETTSGQGQQHISQRSVADQHELSEEMKQLLKDLEKESKQ